MVQEEEPVKGPQPAFLMGSLGLFWVKYDVFATAQCHRVSSGVYECSCTAHSMALLAPQVLGIITLPKRAGISLAFVLMLANWQIFRGEGFTQLSAVYLESCMFAGSYEKIFYTITS